MNTIRQAIQFVFVILVCTSTRAQQDVVSLLYGTQELEEIEERYTPNLNGMWEQDFLSRLTPEERAKAGTVNLKLLPAGESRDPLEEYSFASTRTVFLPIATVKFLDDISVAFAYYGKMGCDTGVVSDYTTVLRFRPQDAKGSPLDALGVPKTDAVLNDQAALNMSKSIVFFTFAHEYAHVMYRHEVKDSTKDQELQRHELVADNFALKVMQRIGVPPTALTFYFLVRSRLEPIPRDPDYEKYLRQPHHTHPASTQRILNVAEAIEAHIADFARLQKDPQTWQKELQVEVTELRTLAENLDNPNMRALLSAKAQSTNIAAFRHACAG